MRARSGKTVLRKRARTRKLAKGFRLSRHNLYRQAIVTLIRGRKFAFRDRQRQQQLQERLHQGLGEEARRQAAATPQGPPPSRWTLETIRATFDWLGDYTLSRVWRQLRRLGLRLRSARVQRFSPDPQYADKVLGLEMALWEARRYPDAVVAVFLDQMGFARWPDPAPDWAGATPVAAPETDYRADVDALLAKVSDRTRVVCLANPNNPTGSYLSKDDVRRLHAGLPGNVLLVIDAAYAEYVRRNDYESGIELVATNENVVMTRTFSKIYGLAALRLGWMYGPAHVVAAINRIRGPFNVSSPAIAAGIAALEDSAHVEKARAHNDRWLQWLTDPASGHAHLIARITQAETVAAITRRERGGQLAPADAAVALADFQYDFARQYLLVEISAGLMAHATAVAGSTAFAATMRCSWPGRWKWKTVFPAWCWFQEMAN